MEEEKNPFDQFDTQPVQEANPFDQFDTPEEPTLEGYTPTPSAEPEVPFWDQPGAGGVPGQSPEAAAEIERYKNLTNDNPEKKLEDVIGTGMYRTGDPQAVYERFKADPRTTRTPRWGWFGDDVLSFEGTIVPEPPQGGVEAVEKDGQLAIERTPGRELGIGTKAGANVTSGVRNMILDATAITDMLLGKEGQWLENTEAAMPKPLPAQGDWDKTMRTASEIGTGMAVGGGIAGGLPKVLGGSTQVAKYLLGQLGTVSALDKDTEGLLFGKGGMLYGVPPDQIYSDAAAERVAKKIDLLYDAVITAGAIEGTARLGMKGWEIVKEAVVEPLLPLFFSGAAKDKVGKDLLEQLNATTPENIDKLVEKVKKYQKYRTEISPEIGEQGFDRTTMSAIAEGAQQEGDSALAKRAMELEEGAIERGAYDLQVKLDDPIQSMGKMQDDAIAAHGGAQSIEDAKNIVANEGIARHAANEASVEDAAMAVSQAEEHARNLLKSDPTFGKLIQDMEKSADFDILTHKGQSENSVIERLTTGVKKLIEKKNALYDQIPDGITINGDKFDDVLVNNERAVNLIPDLKKWLPGVDEAGELEPSLEALPDFKTLNNQILPKVNAALSRARQSGDGELTEQLFNLKNYISGDLLDEIAENAGTVGEEAAAAAQAARKFYREEFVRYDAPGTPTSELIDAYHEAFDGRLKNVPLEKQPKYPDVARGTGNKIKDAQPAASSQVLDLLQEYGDASPKEIVDVFRGDVAAEIQSLMSKPGGIDQIDPDIVVKRMGDKAGIIKQRFPKEYEQLLEFQNRLRSAKGDVNKMNQALDEAKEVARERTKDLNQSVFKEFIERKLGSKLPVAKGNGYQTMRRLFQDRNGLNSIEEVMTLAREEGNERVVEGLKSGFYSFVKEKTSSTNRGFNPREAAKLDSELESLNSYGEAIFGKGDTEYENFKGYIAAVLNENRKHTSKSIAPFAKGYLKTEASKAANTVITMTLGVLNRVAATVRRGVGVGIEAADPAKYADNVLDLIHSDPQYASELFEKISEGMKSKIPSDIKRGVFDLYVRTNVFGPGNPQEKWKEFETWWDKTNILNQEHEELK